MLKSQIGILLGLMAVCSLLRAEPDYVLVEDRGDRACEETIKLLQQSGIHLTASEIFEVRSQISCQQKVTQKIVVSNLIDTPIDKVVPKPLVGLSVEAPKAIGLQLGEKSSWDEISMALRDLGLWGGGIADVPMFLLKPSGTGGVRLRIQQIVSIPDIEVPLQKKPPLGLLIEIPINL